MKCFQNNVVLSTVQTSDREVLHFLKSVDVSKASGPDGIGNKILKLCANGLSSSLSKLINVSLDVGVYPSKWKYTNVAPLFKKDDRQSKLKTNYRPVSLLASLSKKNRKSCIQAALRRAALGG